MQCGYHSVFPRSWQDGLFFSNEIVIMVGGIGNLQVPQSWKDNKYPVQERRLNGLFLRGIHEWESRLNNDRPKNG